MTKLLVRPAATSRRTRVARPWLSTRNLRYLRYLGYLGAGLGLTGIAVVGWGRFTVHPWVLAGWGPAVLAAGLAILVPGNRTSASREGSGR